MTVQRRGDRVWIDTVEGFSPRDYVSSPHGCQARILQALGEPLSYDDLLCYSAFAFRIGVHEGMCPSGAHPCCGCMCMEGSERALPWLVQRLESFPWSPPKEGRAAFEAEARRAVKDSIDRGIPVHYSGDEDGLIIGYGDGGQRWWCVHPYYQGETAFWHDEATGCAGGSWPWGINVWTDAKSPETRLSGRDLTLPALRQALEMWNTWKRDAYFVGDAAYTHWLGWLRGVEDGTTENPKDGMTGNGWYFDVLIHSRRVAGRWLEQRVSTFDGPAATHLRLAAHHYTRLAAEAMAGLDCPWDLALSKNRADDWTRELRQDQIARLEAARKRDRAAAEAIEKALAAAP